MNDRPLTLRLDDRFVEVVAERVAEILAERFEAAAEVRPEWMTPAQAATYTGFTRKRIYACMRAKKDPLRASRDGDRYLIRRADLDAWLAARALDKNGGEDIE